MNFDHIKKNLIKSKDEKLNQKAIRSRFQFLDLNIGLDYFFKSNNLLKCKEHFHYSALCGEYSNNVLESNWLTYSFSTLLAVLCSDNEELIIRYGSELKIRDELIPIRKNNLCPMVAVLALIKNDFDSIEGFVRVLENLKGNKDESVYTELHSNVLKSFLSSDIDSLKKWLLSFEDIKLKNNRIRVNPNEQYISFVPITYLKLALMKGFEIEIESQYIPNELIQTNALDNYSIPYWFLRDYYYDKGINWAYKPIFPLLQK